MSGLSVQIQRFERECSRTERRCRSPLLPGLSLTRPTDASLSFSPAFFLLFIYFIEEERGQSLQSFALLMSNSAFPQSADLAGQSGFGVCRGKPRRLPDILMGKLASLIWLADVVCHWVSITCHSTLMPLDRADQTMSFDLRSTLKADRERDGERKRKGGGGDGAGH